MTPHNDVLLELRRQRGWTQKEAADQLGVDQSTISRIETGWQKATADQLIELVELYGGFVEVAKGPSLAWSLTGSKLWPGHG